MTTETLYARRFRSLQQNWSSEDLARFLLLMNDPTRPGVSLASQQRRRAFPAQSRRKLTAELGVLVVQVLLAEATSAMVRS